LTKTQEQFEALNNLWRFGISDWNEKTEEWFNDPFSDLDTEAMAAAVNKHCKDAAAAHKRLNSDVSGHLKEATADLRAKLSVIQVSAYYLL
jgi:hypothetical protein